MSLKHSHGGSFPSTEEIHAFTLGFFEVLCPWKPQHRLGVATPKYLKDEYHYYLAGRGIGFIALLLILAGIAKLVQVILL